MYFLALATCAYLAVEILIGEGLITYEQGVFGGIDKFPLSWPLIFTVLATAAFATPLHNFIIRGERSFIPRYVGRLALFASLELIPSLLVALFLAGLLDVFDLWPDLLLPLACLFAAILIGVIFTTVLPYVATTPANELKMLDAVRMSAGFRIEIAARLLRLSVAIGIVLFGVQKLLSQMASILPSEDTIIGYYTPLFLVSLGNSASALIFVTLASLIYIRLNQHKNEQALACSTDE